MKSLTQNTRSLQARIVSGSIVLLSGSGLTTAINLVYNVAIARFLGPTGFGHATVVYTLLTLISAITLSFQIVSAKVVAQQDSPEGKAAVYRGFHRVAWGCGILVGIAAPGMSRRDCELSESAWLRSGGNSGCRRGRSMSLLAAVVAIFRARTDSAVSPRTWCLRERSGWAGPC